MKWNVPAKTAGGAVDSRGSRSSRFYFLQRPIHNHSGTVLFLAGSTILPSIRFVIEDLVRQ